MKQKKNIQANKSGFNLPENYFDSLEDSVLAKLKSDSCAEKSGFSLPENYFADFKPETPSEEKSVKVIQLKEWMRWMAAASIVAFAVLGAIYIDSISPDKNIQFSDLEDDMIERYLDEHLETPEEFIDFENASVENIVEENILTLNDQDIMEYLNDKLDEQEFNDD